MVAKSRSPPLSHSEVVASIGKIPYGAILISAGRLIGFNHLSSLLAGEKTMSGTIAQLIQPARPIQVANPPSAFADGLDLPEHLGRNLAVKRDSAIFWEGDPAKYCFRVISGAVRICTLMADGRRQVADFFAGGDMIGFDFADTYAFTAEAVTDSVVRQYPRATILDLLTSDRQLSHQMLALACRRLTSAQHQLVTLGRKTAEERIATFLLALAGRQKRQSRQIELPMSRTDIADHLGLTVETVSRVLTRLRKQNVIELPCPHSVRITDAATLGELGASAA
ncbi:MAG: helix-turn-helix domain-containing protein [Aliidongia sp.]